MFLGTNIKHLRQRKGLTQEAAANEFGITRSTLNNYENTAVLNPTADLLIIFSKYFNISIDVLLKMDLTKFTDKHIDDLQNGYDVYTTGTKLRVLATTVDADNNENVELVSVKAKAGYTSGYSDTEFIKKLPMLSLPFLTKDRKHRAFQITGDSMLPIVSKSYVIAEFVENLNDLISNEAYIIVTVDDGVVFKIVNNQIKTTKKVILSSLNHLYKAYEIEINKVKEAWKFKYYISSQIPEPIRDN